MSKRGFSGSSEPFAIFIVIAISRAPLDTGIYKYLGQVDLGLVLQSRLRCPE